MSCEDFFILFTLLYTALRDVTPAMFRYIFILYEFSIISQFTLYEFSIISQFTLYHSSYHS